MEEITCENPMGLINHKDVKSHIEHFKKTGKWLWDYCPEFGFAELSFDDMVEIMLQAEFNSMPQSEKDRAIKLNKDKQKLLVKNITKHFMCLGKKKNKCLKD